MKLATILLVVLAVGCGETGNAKADADGEMRTDHNEKWGKI